MYIYVYIYIYMYILQHFRIGNKSKARDREKLLEMTGKINRINRKFDELQQGLPKTAG